MKGMDLKDSEAMKLAGHIPSCIAEHWRKHYASFGKNPDYTGVNPTATLEFVCTCWVTTKYAENFTNGVRLVWKDAPVIRATIGTYAAPSTRGVVVGRRTDLVNGFVTEHALVRFHYKAPTGRIGWSEPLDLMADQPCEVEDGDTHWEGTPSDWWGGEIP